MAQNIYTRINNTQKSKARNFKVVHPPAIPIIMFKNQLHQNSAENPPKLPRNWGITAAQLTPNPSTAMQRKRHQMGIKERMKLNTPATESTPRRERLGWDRTEMGSRGFAPSNHGLHYLPAFIAMFAFPMLRSMQNCGFRRFSR